MLPVYTYVCVCVYCSVYMQCVYCSVYIAVCILQCVYCSVYIAVCLMSSILCTICDYMDVTWST